MRSLLRTIVVIATAAAPCPAQTAATNNDGSVVWMRTGWYLPEDPGGAGESFLYRFDHAGATLIARSGPFTGLSRPAVSDNGRVVSWQQATPCRGFCITPGSNAMIEGLDPAKVRIPRLWLTLSQNARWAVTPGFAFQPAIFPFALQNTETGEVWSVPDRTAPKLSLPGAPIDIGDDGTVIGVLDAALVRWRPGMADPVTLVTGRLPLLWGLSADGSRAWMGYGESARREELVWLDLASGRQVEMAPRRPDWVRLSTDGDRAVFPSADGLALVLFDAVRGEARRLIELPDGVRDAALSGDGRAAIVWTGRNRMLRLDVETGEAETKIEGLPETLRQVTAGVPGSAMEISGGPFGLEEIDIRVAGESFPIADRSADRVFLQVPWEFDARAGDPQAFPTRVRLSARRRSGNPFEARGDGWIYAMPVWPVMALADPGRSALIKAAHQDFTRLVSQADPARPGETVHLWLYGLGPLDRPVPTGERGPTEPPARPLAGVACYLMGAQTSENPPAPPARGLRLPFVAYAPGLIGVYQVDATIPEDWPSGVHVLRCEADGRLADGQIPIL